MGASTRRLLLLVTLLWPLSGLGIAKETHLGLCQILASPEKYYEKQITVRGTFRIGF